MKVLHIVGHSGSGKTTFITRLVVQLQKIGSVATIKHLGHHRYELPEGKDTTRFFESGVNCSEGIDNEKSVILLRDTDLLNALYRLADLGMDFAIIEGFKSVDIPGIVFGNLPVPDALMTDPTIELVIDNLRVLPEIQTNSSQERKLRAEWMKNYSVPPECLQCAKEYKTCQGYKARPRGSEKNPGEAGDNRGVVLSLTVGINFKGGIGDTCYEKLCEIIGNISTTRIISETPVFTSVAVRNRLIPPGPEEIYITTISSGYRQGIVAISQICRELKENVTPLGVTLRGID